MTKPTSNSARLAARPIDEGGTSVEKWIGWQREFPALDMDDCQTLLLVAAHPDDETLGLGATAAMLSSRGVTVQLVAVTDGEAAYLDDSGGRKELAKVRRDELVAAAKALGLPAPVFLRLPDGEARHHERRLSARLGMMLAGFDRGTWCAATWRGDGHPDHESTGRAAADAAKRAGARFIEYPIWLWHWAIPNDSAVPWHRCRRIELTQDDMAIKAEAMRCFASQLDRGDGPPLLSSVVVERQMALGEVVFI